MNPKYILGLIGSPRIGGNTDFLVSEILKASKETGVKIEKIYLNELKISPCQGCDHCKTYTTCAQKDDMQSLYRKIHKANGIVLGTPTYFGQETAQTKIFIDRLYALLDKDFNSRIKNRKTGAFVFIWAESSRSYAEHRKPVIEFLSAILQHRLKAKIVGRIIGGGVSSIGDAAGNKKMVRKARVIGKKLGR
ncbi:MAG: flavodoxin family protein [Candidatus Edwardsbacteria bacterium]